jgi:adenylate cyclase class 2
MIEVEVKAKCDTGTKEKLASLGAIFVGVENHLDVYFDSPIKSFATSDEALRIRVKETGAYLTYKGPKIDRETKSRMEETVAVDDAERLEKILNALGFVRAGTVEKRRTKYILGEATIAFDEVLDLGTFLEVELLADEDWSSMKKVAIDIMDQLGLNDLIRKSYLELLYEQI